MTPPPTLLVFGHGYSSAAFVRRVRGRFGRVVATVRSAGKAARLAGEGIEALVFDGASSDPRLATAAAEAAAVLVSVPPGESDPVLDHLGDALAAGPGGRWVGYLSTVGVYGDHEGAWVDEAAELRPASRRSRERVAAEARWLAYGRDTGQAVHLFRLAGIYGPGRGPFAKLRDGTARRLIKPGQVFNRIHVEDIATVLAASLDRPSPGGIYNVTDDEPAPPQDVVAFGAALLGMAPPPEIPFEEAELSPMARSFYGENKRVRNARLRDELGIALAYPTYREGLRAVVEAEAQAGGVK